MFKKLLTNLPYNPSLIGQVSFYAKRLHREEKLRRLGLVFVMLSFFVQMFAFLYQPEPSLASSTNDILNGGFSTRDEAVKKCRDNTQEFKTILAYFGVSCDTLAKASTTSIKSTDYNKALDSMGRNPQGPVVERTGKKTDEYAVKIAGAGTFYMRNLWAFDSGAYSTYKVLKMTNSQGDPIFVLFDCGNIVTTKKYTPPPTGSAVCSKLDATKLTDRSFRYKVTTAGSYYSVSKYIFDFGDGNTKTITSTAASATTDHTYKEIAKNYTTKAQVYVSIQNGTSQPVSKILSCSTAVSVLDVCPTVDGLQNSTSECDVCPEVDGIQSNTADCKPCEEATTDLDGLACVVLTKKATNDTQKINDADGTTAQAGDVITYNLTTRNTGKIDVNNYVIEENMSDVMDYANITELNGGTLVGSLVRWPAVDIKASQEVVKQIVVTVKSPIPATTVSSSDPAHFDLVMNNVYGNAVNIKLPAPVIKTTETIAKTLPNTGPGESMAAVLAFTVFASYFFARTKLFAKEMDIVRTDYATTGGY